MSYTYTQHTSDGVQVTWPFRFAGRDKSYIRASDLHVEKKDGGTWVVEERWQLSGTNQITLNEPLPDGIIFRIRRIVGKEHPYSEFERGVVLDMKALNNCFIQNLQALQETLDGFWPDGYYVKNDLDMGGHRIINLGAGIEPSDAVNKSQLDSVDNKHDEWNKRQDEMLENVRQSLVSTVAQRTIPWAYTAVGGEVEVSPPFLFTSALVFLNGVFQHQLDDAYSIVNNKIVLSEPLTKGDKVYLLIGSRPAAPVVGSTAKISMPVQEGSLTVDTGLAFKEISVYLDGLYQPEQCYDVSGSVLTFKETLPECIFSAELIQA